LIWQKTDETIQIPSNLEPLCRARSLVSLDDIAFDGTGWPDVRPSRAAKAHLNNRAAAEQALAADGAISMFLK
jgi:hypothetical protein